MPVKAIGDGFLVEFASAVAAVNCAVELQEVLARRNLSTLADRQLQVRIGIHLGDVLRRGDDIVGDGVNIAARVEPLADPGGIAITQQVFDQVYNKIPETLARIGKVELKNIRRLVEVYRIILGPKTREAAAGMRETSTPARQPSRKQQRSIAVLPFVNMSSDRENEFLSDGISEDLLNALSWIEGLHVAARTSCFAFKGRNEDIRKIGDALGVETVLEGSLRRVDTKLRITAQLNRAIIAALKLRLAGRVEPLRPEAETVGDLDQPVFKFQTLKSWKTHLAADRTSCTKATANQLRLFLHAGAYWLMWGLSASMPRRSMWRCAVRHVAPAAHQSRRPRRRDEDDDPRSAADVVPRPGYSASRTRAYTAPRHLTDGAQRP